MFIEVTDSVGTSLISIGGGYVICTNDNGTASIRTSLMSDFVPVTETVAEVKAKIIAAQSKDIK